MSSVLRKSGNAGSMQSLWGWSGMSELESTDEHSRLRPLIAMLPRTKSGDAAVLARLIDLRARFSWLAAPGRIWRPSRDEQTAALRGQCLSTFT
jgi:hypothetical protein